MEHAVVIPSTGRPDVLDATVVSVLDQDTLPEEIIVSVANSSDAHPRTHERERVRVLLSPRGSTRQRNYAIRHLNPTIDKVTFIDDDVELVPGFISKVQKAFREFPDVVLFSGPVLADGAGKGGLSREDAKKIARSHRLEKRGEFTEGVFPYGSINVTRSVSERVTFDERLELYGFLEDLDFIVRCGEIGRIGHYSSCKLVHLAVTSGRVAGNRFGFSQIMNPYYLWRKGSISSLGNVLKKWVSGVAANISGMLLGDKLVDRWGRLKGNILAFKFLVQGRIEPEYIVDME